MTAEQQLLEDLFNCPICMQPKSRMITGRCQHRFCEVCLYDPETRTLKLCMTKCPICQMLLSFPFLVPLIPEDNITSQKAVGIIPCPHGCGEEIWKWELEIHQSERCSYSTKSTHSKTASEDTPEMSKSYSKRRFSKRLRVSSTVSYKGML